MDLHIDIRWLLDRQEDLLGKQLTVRDYLGLVAAVARHRVNTPSIEVGSPDAFWRAAALLEQIVLLRRCRHATPTAPRGPGRRSPPLRPARGGMGSPQESGGE